MTHRMVTKPQLEFLIDAEANFPVERDTPYNSPFLRLLVSADSGRLSKSFIQKRCEIGEIVFQEGEPGDTMYMVWSGRVAMVKGDLDSPAILAYRGAGEIIGEEALLENRPRSASIIALEDVLLIGMNRRSFEHLLQETPEVSLSIMEMLSASLRKSNEARSTQDLSEKRLSSQISALRSEKSRLEELFNLRQETTELIIHDLRNPLSSIAVSLKMLSLMLPNDILEANHEILRIAQASVNRMQRLVDTLLEVSRMESGETQFVLEEVDVGAMIEDVVKRISVLDKKQVSITTDITPDLPSITADRDIVERVLTNLMDNAFKYTPEYGSIQWIAKKQGEVIQVSISDTGPGVPPKDRERIFERFAQGADDKTKRRGFGLGLAYCRVAVEGHGGKIWVEPGDGNIGSCFIFTMPIQQQPLE